MKIKKEAFKALEQNLWNPEERRAYQKSLDALNKDIRLQAGIFEEGFEDGLQKGKEAVAINLLKKGKDIIEISELTELTIDQIDALLKKLK